MGGVQGLALELLAIGQFNRRKTQRRMATRAFDFVDRVGHQSKTCMLGMHANLVGAARFQAAHHQGNRHFKQLAEATGVK